MSVKHRYASASLSAFLFLATACGSSSTNAGNLHSAINSLATSILTYDSAHATDILSTGAACKQALDALSRDETLGKPDASSQYRHLLTALKHAYSLAVKGFSHCASGASTNDYRFLARADAELADANRWIGVARALDH